VSKPARWIGLLGVALALAGVWGAWVPHRAAALVLSGWDLAETLKFVPGASVPRDLFYLPAWCGAVALALLTNPNKGRTDQKSNKPTNTLILRLMWVCVALVLMVSILPPYPHTLTGFRSAEYRWRFIMGGGGVLLVLLALTASRWPARWVGGVLLGLALLGAVPAVWQFVQVRNELAAVYGGPIGWGWGLAVFLPGWVLVGVAGGWLFIKGKSFLYP